MSTAYPYEHPHDWRSKFQNSALIERRLRELWEAGTRTVIIADSINKEFGTSLNKNAVIGRAYRLGLGRHKLANDYSSDPVAVAERKARKLENARLWRANNRQRLNENQRRYIERIRERAMAPVIEDFAIPTPQRKTIFELGQHDCRWPVGEPKSDLFFFCGAAVEEKRPYCSAHCRRAYVETRPR